MSDVKGIKVAICERDEMNAVLHGVADKLVGEGYGVLLFAGKDGERDEEYGDNFEIYKVSGGSLAALAKSLGSAMIIDDNVRIAVTYAIAAYCLINPSAIAMLHSLLEDVRKEAEGGES